MLHDVLTLYPESFGIDISDLSVKIAKLKKQGTGFVLVSYGEIAVPSGIVVQGVIKKEKELVQIIKKGVAAVKGEPLETKFVVVLLPDEQAFLQVIQLPLLKKEEVEQAVRFEAENYVPLPLKSVYVDYQVVEPLVNSLNHTDVLVAAFPRTTVDVYVSVLGKAGLVPQILEIESLAIARAVIPQTTASRPVLIVDLGATRTGFTIFSGHSIRFTTSYPFSSNVLTEDIAKTMKIGQGKAEELKREEGITGKKEVAKALAPSLKMLKEEIQKYIAYYESHVPHQHLGKEYRTIQHIVLCGGGANLQGLSEYLSKALGLDISRANPWVNILESPVKELPPLSFQASLSYTCVLGLALRGVLPHD